MLENNQQCTESRTALVEDIVNVVEDSVHHLQGDLSIFVINSQKGLSHHVLWLVWLGIPLLWFKVVLYLAQNMCGEKRRVFRLLYDLYGFFTP